MKKLEFKTKEYKTDSGTIICVKKIPIKWNKYYRYLVIEKKKFVFQTGTLYIMQLVKNNIIQKAWELDEKANIWKIRTL
jgi:hypothetical protein